ncbi:hypothetical protein [Endozoicomonas ascidiicola]|uniref:hypothetical protein n=2 Tax=Endozoicomonas ascidiicola TaxID=1698521 RepID=UPI0008320884|nr:hypothetical protein [Endozoicomonas ascidiicola]
MRKNLAGKVTAKQIISFEQAVVESTPVTCRGAKLVAVKNSVRIAYQNGDYTGLIENSANQPEINRFKCGLCKDIQQRALGAEGLAPFKALKFIPALAGFSKNHFMACTSHHSQPGTYDDYGLNPDQYLEEFLEFLDLYMEGVASENPEHIGCCWMNNPEAGASIPDHAHIHVCDGIDVPLFHQSLTQIYSDNKYSLSRVDEWFGYEVLSMQAKGDKISSLAEPLKKTMQDIINSGMRLNLLFDSAQKRILIVPREPVKTKGALEAKFGALEVAGYMAAKTEAQYDALKGGGESQWQCHYFDSLDKVLVTKEDFNSKCRQVLSASRESLLEIPRVA